MSLDGYYIEDLTEGMSAVFGKTITDADILMFAGVSGDTNPVRGDPTASFTAPTPASQATSTRLGGWRTCQRAASHRGSGTAAMISGTVLF